MAFPTGYKAFPTKKKAAPKKKEVAGPYRSQSSVPSIRSKATAREHRKVTVSTSPSPSAPTSAPVSSSSASSTPSRAPRGRVRRKERQAVVRRRRQTRAATTPFKSGLSAASAKAEGGRKTVEDRRLTEVIKALPPEKYKPPKFGGLKTAGTPTQKQLEDAARKGTLRRKGGFVTTPAVRIAAHNVKKAQAAVRATQPNLSGLSKPEREVVHLARKAHRKYPDIPVSVLMAQDKQESGFNAAAVSSAGAQGLSQFIPSTAASYGVQYGTGAREKQSQVTGQAHLLHDEGFATDPQGALSAYSGGYAAGDYNNPILEDAAASYSALDKPGNPKALRRLRRAKTAARKVGLEVGKPSKKQHADYLKVFGKQVTHQLKLVKAGKYETGPGKLVVGDSDISKGHEPEIAARLKLLSAKVGIPIYIISGDRTPQHSVEVGGFADDPHTEGKAADIGVGSALRDSAGTLTEAQYESVGLHRPYYPESSTEINHVELLNGGTPSTGGGGGSGTVAPVSGGTVLPSGAVSTFASATGQSAKQVRRKLKKGELTPQKIIARLKRVGVHFGGTGESALATPGEEKGPVLSELEKRYGVAAV